MTSGKHSDRDTEPAIFERLGNFFIIWSIQTSQNALYSIKLFSKQHKRNVGAVLTVGILRRISGQCRHQTDNTTRLVSLGRMSAPWPHSNSTVFARTGIVLCVVMSSCTLQILEKLSMLHFQNHGRKSSLWLVQWCPLKVSILSQMSPVGTPLSIIQK